MCGRYAATKNQGDLVEEFEVEVDATGEPARAVMTHQQNPPAGQPDYNVAPTKQAPVVLSRPPRGSDDGAAPVRQLRLLNWGLVPSWAKDVKVGNRMINARADSVLEKPAFKRAAKSRRCLVPAEGWYEWQKSPTEMDAKGKPRKQPFYTHRADGDVMAFAGLYEFWRDKAIEDPDDPEAWLTSFTIITTDAEPGLDRIHDRQPLVLERSDWAAWLDPETDEDDASDGCWRSRSPAGSTPTRSRPRSTTPATTAPSCCCRLAAEELHGVVDIVTGEVIGAR